MGRHVAQVQGPRQNANNKTWRKLMLFLIRAYTTGNTIKWGETGQRAGRCCWYRCENDAINVPLPLSLFLFLKFGRLVLFPFYQWRGLTLLDLIGTCIHRFRMATVFSNLKWWNNYFVLCCLRGLKKWMIKYPEWAWLRNAVSNDHAPGDAHGKWCNRARSNN